MAITEGQIQLGDLVMGRGTDYHLLRTDFFSWPANRSSRKANATQSGSNFDSFDLFSGAVASFDIMIQSSDLLGAMRALSIAAEASLQDEMIELLAWLPHDGSAKKMVGRTRTLTFPEYSRSTYSRSTACVLIFEAELPYSTSGSTNQQDITPRTISGGHTFNLTFDHTFGIIGTGGYVQINNEGSSATYPTFRIYGPIQFPKIENTDTGDYLELIITIQGGDYIEINTRTAEITINGSASRYYALTNDSRWFTLKPGKTILACSALYHASPAKLSTFWENAYRV